MVTKKKVVRRAKVTKETEWDFKIAANGAIDFALVESELSHERPMALMTVTTDRHAQHLLVVHPHLVKKMEAKRYIVPGLGHSVKIVGNAKTKGNVYLCQKNKPAELIEFFKMVQRAPWGCQHRDATVHVKMLEV